MTYTEEEARQLVEARQRGQAYLKQKSCKNCKSHDECIMPGKDVDQNDALTKELLRRPHSGLVDMARKMTPGSEVLKQARRLGLDESKLAPWEQWLREGRGEKE